MHVTKKRSQSKGSLRRSGEKRSKEGSKKKEVKARILSSKGLKKEYKLIFYREFSEL